MNSRLAVVTVFAIATAGCANFFGPTRSTEAEWVVVEAEFCPRVDVKDGVNRAEADALANYYFLTMLGLCGSAEFQRESAHVWIYSTRVGYAGSRGPDIHVQKDGSRVTATGMSTLTHQDGKWVYKIDRKQAEEQDRARESSEIMKKAESLPPTSGLPNFHNPSQNKEITK